jgi:hypothetical protein
MMNSRIVGSADFDRGVMRIHLGTPNPYLVHMPQDLRASMDLTGVTTWARSTGIIDSTDLIVSTD